MSTPTRKRSLSGPSGSVKKKKYNCKFQANWMKDFQFLRSSSLGNESSFCTLCLVNFWELANDTICSLICAKQNQNMECYEYCPDSEVMKKAKTACIDYNNELKKLSIFINSYWCFVDVHVYSVQVIYLGWKCHSHKISPSAVIAEGEISLIEGFRGWQVCLASLPPVYYLLSDQVTPARFILRLHCKVGFSK